MSSASSGQVAPSARVHRASALPVPEAGVRGASFDDLRGFVVLLVMLHQSVLVYMVRGRRPQILICL
jgi:hypothetical protein